VCGCFYTNKKHNNKNIFLKIKKIKNMFLNFYKTIKNIFTSMVPTSVETYVSAKLQHCRRNIKLSGL